MKAASTRPAWIAVVLWAALVVWLNTRDAFAMGGARLPWPLLVAVAIPPILFGVGYGLSERVRTISHALDLRLLTAMQAWRLVGAMFLVLMWFHLLPGTFAWPAGVGDAIVGAYAPFVVAAMLRGAPSWRRHAVLLNVLGLVDFVGAIGGGVLSGTSPIAIFHGPVTTEIMQSLPLSLIPTFGVPFWIILHIISLAQLRRQQEPQAVLCAA